MLCYINIFYGRVSRVDGQLLVSNIIDTVRFLEELWDIIGVSGFETLCIFHVTPRRDRRVPPCQLPLRVMELWGAALGITKLTSVPQHGNCELHCGVLYHITIWWPDPASLCRWRCCHIWLQSAECRSKSTRYIIIITTNLSRLVQPNGGKCEVHGLWKGDWGSVVPPSPVNCK